jgi:hypothetical protein
MHTHIGTLFHRTKKREVYHTIFIIAHSGILSLVIHYLCHSLLSGKRAKEFIERIILILDSVLRLCIYHQAVRLHIIHIPFILSLARTKTGAKGNYKNKPY